MKISLGFSPCPNDTFIFDALVNSKIDSWGLDFDVVMEDIQTLNSYASSQELDVTKLSFPAFFRQQQHYAMLDSGGALGEGVGPLLVAKSLVQLSDLEHLTVGIPGVDTTANFLLSFAFPAITHKVPMMFSEIEDAVLTGKTDLGVIIHENRFTYHQKGLIKVCDLGEIWQQRLSLPIPLACIAVKKSLGEEFAQKMSELIRESVDFAFKHYPSITDYTKANAQEMDEDVMRKHIELYVNSYSRSLGIKGNQAVEKFKELSIQRG